jgi:hypothetical protein
MRPSTIRQTGQDIFKHLLKPSCMDCKLFYEITPSNIKSIDEKFYQSRCRKFIITPIQNIYIENKDITYENVYKKYPYALLARFDNKMCGLNGKYFTKK